MFSIRRLEPSSVFRLTFRVASSVSTFRVVITSQFDVHGHHHYFFSFGVQSHHRFSDRHSESHPQFRRSEPSSSLLSFGVQSHHRFSVLAFRAITIFSLAFRAVITSQSAFRAIDISSLGVRSHHHSFVSTFKSITISIFDDQIHRHSQFRFSEPSLLLSFGIQSH